MLKVPIDKARVHVVARWHVDGSVLAGTIQGDCDGVETHLEVESSDTPDRVAAVIKNAENGCFVMRALVKPVPIESKVTFNGEALDLNQYSTRLRR